MHTAISGTRRWLLLGGFAAALGLAALVMMLDERVRAYLAGPPLGGARIFAAPRTLRVGQPLPGGSLGRALGRLGYRRSTDTNTALVPGEFRAVGETVEIAQRPSPAPWGEPPRRVRITLQGSRVSELRDSETGPLASVELEPEML